MTRKVIDLRYNADGTVTASYGTDRKTFTIEPWMTKDEIYEHAKYELFALGVKINYADDMTSEGGTR